MDLKYDILKHPNVAGTADGKVVPYFHGEVTSAVAAIEYLDIDPAVLDSDEETNGNFELLSEEERENYLKMRKTNYMSKRKNDIKRGMTEK